MPGAFAMFVVRAVVIALCAALVAVSYASADEPYYKGKRLSLIINFAAGGPTDIEAGCWPSTWSSTSTAPGSSSRTWTARAG
jgi:hypothetical protein